MPTYQIFALLTYGWRSLRWAMLVLLMAGLPLEAAVVQWTGGAGGGDTNWSTAANWNGGVPAGVGDTAEFATGGASVYLDGSRTVAGITFNSAGNFAIGGAAGSTLTIGASGVTVTSNRNFSITCPLALSASQTWAHSGTGSLTVSGAVAVTASQIWTLDGTGSMALSGVISGTTITLTKASTSTGTLTLSGTNTYTGVTNVNGGLVVANNNSAFGSSAVGSNTVVASGAAVQLNAFTVAEILTLSGTGIGNTGALVGSGNGTWSGAVTLAADTTIGVGSGFTTIIGGIVSGGFALTKIAMGTLTLSGNNNPTYTGQTNVNEGTLIVNHASALGTNAAGTIVSSNAAVQVNNGITVASEALTLSGAGIGTTGALVGAGTGTWNGTVALVADTTIGGTGNTGTIGGIVSGGFALTKVGSGTWTLSGANTYTGATTITTGTLRVTGSTVAASAVSVGTGTFLEGTGTVAGTVSVAGTGSISPGTGVNTIGTLTTGAVTYGATTSVLRVDLNGTGVPPLANDRLTSTGVVALAGNVLTIGSVINATNGVVYTIVSGTSVTGTFAGLPEGAILIFGGRGFRVNYYPTSVTLTDAVAAVVWDGGGANNNWTTAANWVGDVAPVAGDALIFSGATRLAPWNNFAAGTAFTSITFSAGAGDFVLGGDNALTLTGGTTAITNSATTGTMTISSALTFSAAAPTITSAAGSTLELSGAITNGDLMTVAANGLVTISGAISGTGTLTKTGGSVLTLSGTNTFTGATTITAGTLRVTGSTAAASAVSVGSGTTLDGTGTVAGTVSVAGTGIISPGIGGNTIGTLTTGAVTFGATTNVLRVDLNGTLPTYDQLSSSGVVALGSNVLTIGSAINGTKGRVYTIVSGSSVTGTFAGLPEGAILTSNGRGFLVNYLPTSVTLTESASVWDGGSLIDNNWTTAENWVGDVAPVAGDPLIFAGTTRLASANDFVGTAFASITFSAGAGDFVLSGNAFTLTGGTTAITNSATTGTMTISNALTFSTAAPTITSSAGGTLVLSNTIDNGGLLTTVAANGPVTISGAVAGAGNLTKIGGSVLTLSGTNTFTGATTITTGTLRVTGSTAAASAASVGTGTTLDGTGTVAGTVSVAGSGTISPGIGGNTIGTLTTGAVTYAAATNVLRVDLDGAVPTYDQLNSSGAVALAGNVLTIGSVTNATTGRVYTIVSGSSVTGTFAGLPEGAILMFNGRGYLVNYLPTSVTLRDYASVWDGGSLIDNNWTTAENWVGDVAPVAGDPLIFAGGTRLAPFNNFTADTAFTSITFLAGAGDFTLGGNAFTLTGGTTAITNNATTGTMTIGNALTFTTTAPTITSAAGGTLVLSGTVSGADALTKTGTGVLALSGVNDFTGTVTVSGGTLRVAGGSAIPDACAVTLNNTAGVVLDLNGSSETIGSLAGGGGTGGTVTLGTGTLTAGGNNTSTTYGGVIGGTGGAVVKAGTGTWTVSGTNTYTGTTTVSVGTLVINSAAALGGGGATAATGTTVVSGATLQLNAFIVAAEVLTLSGTGVGGNGALINSGGTGTWNGNVILAADSSLGGTTSAIIGGVISDGVGGPFALTKVGVSPCLWRLDGANTYAGLTTVSAGTLAINNATGLGSAASGTIVDNTLVATNATLRLDGVTVASEALTISGTGVGGLGALLGNAVSPASGSWGGPVTLVANTSIGGSTSGNHTISGVISGAFALTKLGTGTWILSGANTYDGLTTVGAGTLSVQHDLALGTTTFGTSVTSGATLDLTGTRTITGETLSLNGVGVGSLGALTATGSNCLWTGPVTMTLVSASLGGSGSGTISGTIGGGFALTKVGSGTWTLAAANGYTGLTTVSAGTLVVGDALALGTTAAGTVVTSGATLQVGAFAIVGETLTIGGTGVANVGALVTSGTGSWSGTVALGSNATIAVAGITTFSGVVSGASILTKDGVGEARLTAVNSFGGLVINGGSVRLSGGAALSDSAGVTLSNTVATVLDLAGVSETIGALSGGISGGVVTLGAGTLTTGTTGSPTFGGVISGSGGLNITGSGTMTLTATSTYTGATTITGATVVLSGDLAAIPQSVSLTLSGGATLSIPGVGTVNPDRIADSATVTMQGATISMAAAGFNRSEAIGGLIFASGVNVITLVPNGANTAILSASGYGHSAGATLTFNPTDAMYTKLFFTSAIDGEVLGWSTVTSPTTGVGQYSTANGLVVMGSSKVTAQAGDWATPATWSPVGVPLASDTVQVLHAVDLTTDQTVVSMTIGTNGSIAAPSGRRTLTVTSGGVQVSGATSPTIDANLTAGSADVLLQHNGTGTLTILGAISGGNLGISAGTASVRLQGANLYSGFTTVFSGTLVAANPLALASTTVGTRVADGAALVLDGVAVGAEALMIRGIGPGGIGALGAIGTSSATGAITLEAATSVGGSGTLSLSGVISGAFALTKVGSGTVVLSGTNTYSGGTTISTGTLQAVRTSLPGAVVNNATLAISESGTGTFTAGVTGPGDFVKLGSGTLILVSPTLITGTTTISQGTLQLNSTATTTVDSRVSGPVVNNETLIFNHVLPAFPANNMPLFYTGIISGTGALTKLGDGVLDLNGASTFTGTTTVQAGTLRVSADVVSNVAGALGNSAAAVTVTGGVLEVNTANVSRPLVIGAAGGRIDAYGSARTVSSPITVSALSTGGGLTSSIVAASLRAVLLDDWRTSQAIAGTRIDPLVNYTVNAFGTAAEFSAFGFTATNGGTTDWHNFSSQWDGYLRVPNANTNLYLLTDDTSRLWIDFNDNGIPDAGEWSGFVATNSQTRVTASPLAAGTYRIRLQYEEGIGGNFARFLWTDAANSAGTVGAQYVIPSAFFTGFAIGGVTTTGATGQTLTLAGAIGGTGSLSKVGTSTALLNAGNTYAGGTYVVAGTLRSGAAEVLPDQTLVVDALATLDLASFAETVGGLSGRGSVTLGSATLSVGSGGGAGTFSGVISGSGGITKVGTGTQVFSGANSYLGTTQVMAGVLAAADALALGDAAGATVVDNGSSLEVRGVTVASENITLNGLGDAGSGALRSTGTAVVGGTINLATASSVITTGDLTLAGAVSGGGAWSLSGGTITLSAINTFTGVTTVASGTVIIGNNAALGTTAGGTVVSSGATLALTGATIAGEGLTLSGAGVGGVGALSNNTDGSGTWSGDIILAADATIGGSGTTTTLSGVISGSGGLTKAGSGTYFLSGGNTFTGATTVSAGTMTLVGDTGSIAASSALLIGNGATLVINPSGAANPNRIGDTVDVTFTGGTLTIQAPASVSCTETVGRLVIASGANLIDLHPTLTLLTQLTATNGFSRTSPATFTLDRNVLEGTANLFLGGVSNGTVFTWTNVIESSTAIGRYSTVDGLVGISGGFYTVAPGLWTVPATWFGGNVPGVGDVVDVRHAVGLDSDQGVVSLGISLDGQIIIDSAVRRQLTIGAGTVTIASGSTAPLIDANLAFAAVDAVIRQDAAVTATIVGVISGSGSVTKTGAGSLRLEGANTYSGATQIAAGTVILAHTNALGTSGAGTTVDTGASIDLDGITLAAEPVVLSGNGPGGLGALTAANTAGTTGTITLAADASVGGSGTVTLAGVVGGSGRLTKVGSGTVVLSAVNTYSGGTTISAGTLRGAATAFPGNIIDQATLEFAQPVTDTYAFLISGSGALRKTGSGTLILSGLSTYTGTTTIEAGILRVTGDVVAGAAGPLGAANTAVVLAGGSLESATTTLSRPLLVSAAGVRIDAIGTARTIASPISASGSQVLTVGNSTGVTPTFSGALSDGVGTLALVKDGSNTVILTGANTYSGGTTVSAGTLQGSATALQGNIANAAALIFDQTGVATFSGLISGTGTVTKIGSGTVVMGSANTYSGLTTILAGTMRASAQVIAGTAGPFGLSAAAVVLDGGGIESDTDVFSRPISVAAAGGQLDAYGSDRTISAPITLASAGPGMTASIVSSSLRLVTEDDWRVTQTIVGTRIDPLADYRSAIQPAFGTAAEFAAYALTSTAVLPTVQWEDFSIQWDGWVSVLVPNTVLYTASDDGSRAWIDADQDGVIDAGEWASNNWGNGQGTTARAISGPLAPGLYRVRLQFEQGAGGASMSLVWNDTANSGGAYVVGGVTYHVIPTARFAPFQVGGTTVAGAGGQIMTLTGGISDSNGRSGLQKVGTSTVVLGAANTYGGSTLVQAGTLRSGALGALPPNPIGILAAGTCDLAGFDQVVGTLSGSGALTLGAANLSVTSATASLFEGVLSGSGGLTKLGAAKLTLSADNSAFTGLVQVTAGTLSARSATALGSGSSAVTVADGTSIELVGITVPARPLIVNGIGVGGLGALQASGTSVWNGPVTLASASTVTTSGTLTLAGVLSGGAALTKSGAGSLLLSGTNTWTGDLVIAAGQVAVSGGAAIGDLASVTLANVAGAVFATNASETIGSLAGGGGVGGNVSLGTSTLTLGDNNTSTTFAGAMSGTGSLVKSGSGTFTLSGTNTASGPTTVSVGELAVTGTMVSSVSAANGTTLSGTGSLGVGTLSTATLRPGSAGPGTLTLAALNLSATSVLEFELGTASDRVAVTGAGVVDGILNVTALSGFGIGTYPLFTIGGTVTDQGIVFGTMPGGFTYQLDLTTTPGTVLLVVGAQTVQVAATDAAASEAGLDPGQFTITRTGTNGDLVVAYTVSGTATAGTDYVAVSGTVTILDGATTATVTITPIDDQATVGFAAASQSLPGGTTTVTIPVVLTGVESDPETIIMTLDPAATYALGATITDTVNLADDDQSAASLDVTVTFVVTGLYPELGDQVVTANPLVIPAGNTSANIVITLAATPWSNRTFNATLSAPVNASLGTSTHVVDIPASPADDSRSRLNQCGLGSGLTVLLLMLGLVTLRWRRD